MFPRVNPRAFGGLALTALLSLFSAAFAQRAFGGEVGAGVYSELQAHDSVRVIVMFEAPPPSGAELRSRAAGIAEARSAILSRLLPNEFQLVYAWGSIGGFAGRATKGGIAKLESMPNVRRVVLDVGGGGGLAQSVPLINADQVEQMGFTGKGARVAILDTGVDTDHPDLADAIVDEHCFCQAEGGGGCCPGGLTERGGAGSAEDDNGHGSNIAGIITSNGLVAPRGIAPDSEIVAVKVLDSANRFVSGSQVISGIDWVVMNHPEVDVINMSLGTTTLFSGVCDNEDTAAPFRDAIKALRAVGIVVVVSTQNDRSGTAIAVPACLSDTIAVSAVYDSDFGPNLSFDCLDLVTKADKVPCFANSNAVTDLMAPGSRILSTAPGGGVASQSGTSQAAAHVSASAAVLRVIDPALSQEEILDLLSSTGPIVVDSKNDLPFPRINLLAAVNALSGVGVEICNDGKDNDGDGLIDSEDPDCQAGTGGTGNGSILSGSGCSIAPPATPPHAALPLAAPLMGYSLLAFAALLITLRGRLRRILAWLVSIACGGDRVSFYILRR